MKPKLKHFDRMSQALEFIQEELYQTLVDDAHDLANGPGVCAELRHKAHDVDVAMNHAMKILSLSRVLATMGVFDQRGSDAQQVAEVKAEMAKLVAGLGL